MNQVEIIWVQFDSRINESIVFDKTDTMNASLQSVIIDNRTETLKPKKSLKYKPLIKNEVPNHSCSQPKGGK
jgi:hypothetical protein